MTTPPKTFPKPPIVLPKPKVAGVASVPSNTTPATPAPSDSVDTTSEYPRTLPNGDILLAEETNLFGNHKIQLIERKDPSQFIPLYMKCSCGTEGRFYSMDVMRKYTDLHKERHPR